MSQSIGRQTKERLEEGPREGDRRAAGVKLALVILLGAGTAAIVVYRESRQDARDRRAILRQVRDIEQTVRRHDSFVALEADHHGSLDAATESVHAALVRDLDRLSHLEGSSMNNLQAHVAADTARVQYEVVGTAVRAGERPPRRGEFQFRRTARGWEIVAHRFLEQP